MATEYTSTKRRRFSPELTSTLASGYLLSNITKDLVAGAGVGVVLALVLFLKRVCETSSVRPVQDLLGSDSDKEGSIPSQYDGAVDATGLNALGSSMGLSALFGPENI